jgi:hypothetical protein
MPRTKFLVPSIGSTIQRVLAVPLGDPRPDLLFDLPVGDGNRRQVSLRIDRERPGAEPAHADRVGGVGE